MRLETQDAAGHGSGVGHGARRSDGSFFVKVPADRPIRFALLDEKGAVLRQEHGWFWIRRGEQRICVGCHTGPERAAENRVPAVLLRSTTPVDLTGAQRARQCAAPQRRGAAEMNVIRILLLLVISFRRCSVRDSMCRATDRAAGADGPTASGAAGAVSPTAGADPL